MDRRRKNERAQFWAQLASVDSLEDLSRPAREESERIWALILKENGAETRMTDPRFAVDKTHATAQRTAREFLRRVVANEKLPTFEREGKYELRRGPDGRYYEQPVFGEGENKVVVIDYAEIARNEIFRELNRVTFAHCPECGTIFERLASKKYCSPNCTAKALETARKDQKANYMRTYRKRQRKRRGKGE